MARKTTLAIKGDSHIPNSKRFTIVDLLWYNDNR